MKGVKRVKSCLIVTIALVAMVGVKQREASFSISRQLDKMTTKHELTDYVTTQQVFQTCPEQFELAVTIFLSEKPVLAMDVTLVNPKEPMNHVLIHSVLVATNQKEQVNEISNVVGLKLSPEAFNISPLEDEVNSLSFGSHTSFQSTTTLEAYLDTVTAMKVYVNWVDEKGKTQTVFVKVPVEQFSVKFMTLDT